MSSKISIGLLLVAFSSASLADVYGPSASASGNFSISWDLYEGSEMGCGEPTVYIDGPYGSTTENTSDVFSTSYSFSNLYDGAYNISVEVECEDNNGYSENVNLGSTTVTVTNNPKPVPQPIVCTEYSGSYDTEALTDSQVAEKVAKLEDDRDNLIEECDDDYLSCEGSIQAEYDMIISNVYLDGPTSVEYNYTICK